MDADPRASAQPDADAREAAPALGRPGQRGKAAGGNVRLRAMGPEDLPFVTREHRHFFPDGFFARLGQAFLIEYYRPYLDSRHARAYIADVDGRRAGFLVGVTDPAAHRRHVLRAHGRALVLRAVVSLLVRPRLAVHFLRTRLGRYYRKLRPRGPVADPGVLDPRERVAVLADVAVTEQAQSRGVGSALVDRFVADASAAGCGRITLVTEAGAHGAGRYYANRGWQLRGERRSPDGRLLATYDRPLGGQSGMDRTHSVGAGG